MRRRRYLLCLLLFVPAFGYSQQARLSGKVSLDTGWVLRFYISRIPGFDFMFTASKALIIAEGNIDAAGNFSVSFPATQDESLYRLHFIRKGDPASTLIIGSRDVNHVFFIAKQADRIDFQKDKGQPISQSGISGGKANAEFNALIRLIDNDTTGNSTLIAAADRSASQLVGLLVINHTFGMNEPQKAQVRDILTRYDQHSAYGANLFREYSGANYWKLYLAGAALLASALLLYGYRFYKRRAIFKIWRELSQREMAIVGLILSGRSNKEVALALSIELSTVKTHVNNIYAKLRIKNRKDLERYKDLMKKTLFILLFSLAGFATHAQTAISYNYTWREVMIPMRDGIKLHTVICSPIKTGEKLPFIMIRTPYGSGHGSDPLKSNYVKDMAAEGYFFIYQDIRGRYGSAGKFEMTRLGRDKKDPKSIDEASDTYDTIDWLLKNVPENNGKVGILGISYSGWLAIIAAADPHPALKAVSEQATPYDMFMNDDLHHNGAFRLSYGFEYSVLTEAAKTDSLYNFGEYDTYDWYLRLGPLSNINQKYAHGTLPTWNNFIAHPDYDQFWKKQSMRSRLDYPKVPTQHVGGWWDQEDMAGPQEAYRQLEKKDSSNRNFLVIGPWLHGQWGGDEASNLAAIKFGQPTGLYFRQKLQARWFAYYLKGKGDGNFSEMTSFQTGSNQWKRYNAWPPKEVINKKLYLQANGKLSFAPPVKETKPFDSYISDPAKPVPFYPRPIEETYGPNSHWYFWLATSQRFVDHRPDVLQWQTDTLTEDLTITGNVMAKLFASTSGTDADWVVKLIDVYPKLMPKELNMSGYELMTNADIIRARYRNSFSKPEALTPNKVEGFTIDLRGADHVFQKGHRIMVQVQSTWFPAYDRNPQKFVPNIYKATEKDYRTAIQKIWHATGAASYIELPVADKP